MRLGRSVDDLVGLSGLLDIWRIKVKKTKCLTPYVFVAPAVLILLFCSIIPIIITFGISFTDLGLAQLGKWNLLKFKGFSNYANILSDRVFQKSITNTLYYVCAGVPIVIAVSFLLAFLLHGGGERKIFSFFRAVFYSPSVTNMVAVSIVWLYLFNPSIGLFNDVLEFIGLEPIMWLKSPSTAKNSLLILSVWRNMGLNMLIFLAALQSVPKELYEASSLDGAGKLTQLFKITFPNIMFSVFFVIVTTLIGWFQYFEEVYVMTEGGPANSTISMTYYVYRTGFWSGRFGQAAAASVILFLFILVVTLVQLWLQAQNDK